MFLTCSSSEFPKTSPRFFSVRLRRIAVGLEAALAAPEIGNCRYRSATINYLDHHDNHDHHANHEHDDDDNDDDDHHRRRRRRRRCRRRRRRRCHHHNTNDPLKFGQAPLDACL